MASDAASPRLQDLLVTTKDGDWGRESSTTGFVPYRVIRGADFPAVRVGDTSSVPIRYLASSTISRRTLEPDDILLETAGGSRDRPTGRSLLITNRLLNSLDLPATCASFARFLRVDRRMADPRYVYWYLQHLYSSGRMDEHQVQHTGVARFQYTKFAESQRIPLPAMSEQRAIAHILGTLDDKIELNRRMNETLEAIARALFKSWFVDFDPVRAKAEGHDPGLPKILIDLFPDDFEDCALGEIPRGWKMGCFSDIVEPLRDPENPLASPDVLYRHFSIPAFDDGQWPKIEFGQSIKSLKSRVPPGAILLSKLNPEIERVWLVDVDATDRAVCSTEFLVLRPHSSFGKSYVYCLARSPTFRRQIEALATGTSNSHQRACVDTILSLAAVHPPKSIVDAFEEVTSPLLHRTLMCRRESRTLVALRDTLLPKLINGELRVKDAQRSV